MSSETSPQWEILANIRISFKVRRGRRGGSTGGGGHSSAPDRESLMQRSFWNAGSRAETEPTGTETRSLPPGSLSNTRKKKNHPSLHGQRRRHGDRFELQRSVTHMGGGGGTGDVCRRRGGEGWISTYSTVYSECIVKCVCRQVLLNYIFVCKTETDVSFFYGGTTGSEQRHLEMMSNCLSI